MPMIEFVQNYEDLSTDHGYQFKFHCDRCHNGFMSRFQTSAIGMAGSALRVAGDFFGGIIGTAGGSAYEVQRAVGGKAHDDAIAVAVQEGKQLFKQCTRCGKWVCGQVCFNAQVGQCMDCAPSYQNELAASHAHAKVDAARQQLQKAAQEQDYAAGVDMSANAYQQSPPGAPQMAAPQQAAAPQLAAAGSACHKCNMQLGAFKFCPNCGSPRMQPVACGKCGTAPIPGMKFCGGCGAPMG